MKIKKTRIAIAGIGGIGGYIGGKLAYHFSNNENVELVFIARGKNYEVIRERGMELLSKEILYHCVPTLTTNNPLEIGKIDLFIICTKSFNVLEVIKAYKDSFTSDTTVITTQNTVNGKETVIPYLPQGAKLMEGSIYIASNLIKPGRVEHNSGPAKFIFGTDEEEDIKGEQISKILNDAGIDATFTTTIKTVLWKKFIFVSSAAIVTALFKITFSEILQHLAAKQLYINLISELMQVAKAKNIAVDEETIQNNINILGSFNEKAKSSFQLDLEKDKPTEIDTLVKYVIQEAKLVQVRVPNFTKAIIHLTETYKNLV